MYVGSVVDNLNAAAFVVKSSKQPKPAKTRRRSLVCVSAAIV
jgi:hypothetical protein